jgi:hypothetical protein
VCLVRTACPPQGIDAQVGCMRDESAVFQSEGGQRRTEP